MGEAAIAMAVYRIVFVKLMSSFYLGLIGPRAVGQEGALRAVWDRVNL